MLNFDLVFWLKGLLVSKHFYAMLFLFGISLIVLTAMGFSKNVLSQNTVSFGTSDTKNNTEDPLLNASTEIQEIYVDIGGAVNKPGIYKLENGARLSDLFTASGGINSELAASQWFFKNINLSKKLSDQQKIYIPFEWEIYESTQSIADLDTFNVITNADGTKEDMLPKADETEKQTVKQTITTVSTSSTDSTSSTSSSINVNTATQDELESLPGIGSVYAQRIIQNRPYTSTEDLKSKAKLTDSVLSKIKDAITF